MFTLTIIIAVSYILWLYLKENLKKRKYRSISKIYGGPTELPLIGVFYKAWKPKEFLYECTKLIRNIESKSAFIWYFSFPTLYTQNPEFVEKIFLSPDCHTKSVSYDLIDKEAGSGLITIEGLKWVHHKKHIGPSFSHQVLMTLLPIFRDKSSAFVEELNDLVGKGEVELLEYIQGYTIKTTLAALIDFEMDDGVQRNEDFIMHAHRFMGIIAERVVNFNMYFGPMFRLSKLYKPFKASQKFVKEYMCGLVNDKMKSIKMENHQITDEDNCIDIKKTKRKFIDQVIDAYQKDMLSLKEVYEESITFFFASYETSGTTIYSSLVFLAMHPQYQEKLFQEVKTMYPEKDSAVKYEDLKDLLYLDMVVNETLRVASTVPFLSRVSTNDVMIAKDLVLPKGTTIIMDTFNMHRNEDIWGPNAKKFNPDNFLPENLYSKHAYCFTPFAKGGRMCIGWKYAELFLKITLVKIVRNYRLTTKFRYEDLRYIPNVTLRYKITPKLEIQRR